MEAEVSQFKNWCFPEWYCSIRRPAIRMNGFFAVSTAFFAGRRLFFCSPTAFFLQSNGFFFAGNVKKLQALK
jgi:hypothetical protein